MDFDNGEVYDTKTGKTVVEVEDFEYICGDLEKQIMEHRTPLDLFYTTEKDEDGRYKFVGIDNRYGYASIKKFDNIEECKTWLKDLKENIDSNKQIALEAMIPEQFERWELECLHRHIKMFNSIVTFKKNNVPDACVGCKHYCNENIRVLDPWPVFLKVYRLSRVYSGSDVASK